MGEARVLLFDIETAPNISYTWGKYDQNVVKFEQEWFVLCFGWKFLGDKQTQVLGLPDYAGYDTDKTNDYFLVKTLRDLIDEADVVVAHNGDRFDLPKARARWLVHDIDPPSPVKTVDTLKVARNVAMFNSNSLGDLGDTLGIGAKGNTGGFQTWLDCMNGDRKAWNRMMRYCKQDVSLLERLYLRLRPYMDTHPNIAILGEDQTGCPTCGKGPMVKRGTRKAGISYVYDRYQCQSCKAYSRGRNRIEQEPPSYVK